MSGGTRKAEYIAVLQSELVTQSFIKSRDLLPVLYSNLWDSRDARWKTNDPDKQPTLWKAYKLFNKKIRNVTEDKTTGLVTMRIEWKDARQAADWANGLVQLTNQYLRNKAISEAERNIAYLNSEAAKTNIVEVKTSIYALLQQEINTEMVARGRDEYALKVIDPAYVPEKPVSLGPLTLAIFGLLAGGLGCLTFILVRRIYSKS